MFKRCNATRRIILFTLVIGLCAMFGANAEDFIYRLGPGDKIRINVFNEKDLSGEYEVDPSGNVSLALIGSIRAKGLDTQTLEEAVKKQYAQGYLIDPRISIEVLNFRPFFILGEVNKPGSYPYVNGLSVLNAVALAGGYTHRAKTSEVIIKREKTSDNDLQVQEIRAKEHQLVHPGDIIRVQERFF